MFNGKALKLGRNYRGKAEARRVMRDYIQIRQGRNVVVLTEKQLRKLGCLRNPT